MPKDTCRWSVTDGSGNKHDVRRLSIVEPDGTARQLGPSRGRSDGALTWRAARRRLRRGARLLLDLDGFGRLELPGDMLSVSARPSRQPQAPFRCKVMDARELTWRDPTAHEQQEISRMLLLSTLSRTRADAGASKGFSRWVISAVAEHVLTSRDTLFGLVDVKYNLLLRRRLELLLSRSEGLDGSGSIPQAQRAVGEALAALVSSSGSLIADDPELLRESERLYPGLPAHHRELLARGVLEDAEAYDLSGPLLRPREEAATYEPTAVELLQVSPPVAAINAALASKGSGTLTEDRTRRYFEARRLMAAAEEAYPGFLEWASSPQGSAFLDKDPDLAAECARSLSPFSTDVEASLTEMHARFAVAASNAKSFPALARSPVFLEALRDQADAASRAARRIARGGEMHPEDTEGLRDEVPGLGLASIRQWDLAAGHEDGLWPSELAGTLVGGVNDSHGLMHGFAYHEAVHVARRYADHMREVAAILDRKLSAASGRGPSVPRWAASRAASSLADSLHASGSVPSEPEGLGHMFRLLHDVADLESYDRTLVGLSHMRRDIELDIGWEDAVSSELPQKLAGLGSAPGSLHAERFRVAKDEEDAAAALQRAAGRIIRSPLLLGPEARILSEALPDMHSGSNDDREDMARRVSRMLADHEELREKAASMLSPDSPRHILWRNLADSILDVPTSGSHPDLDGTSEAELQSDSRSSYRRPEGPPAGVALREARSRAMADIGERIRILRTLEALCSEMPVGSGIST